MIIIIHATVYAELFLDLNNAVIKFIFFLVLSFLINLHFSYMSMNDCYLVVE